MKDLDYANIYSVNPLYLIFNNVDGYIEAKMEMKVYFLLMQIKKKLTKYTELWNKIKNLIETINGKSG